MPGHAESPDNLVASTKPALRLNSTPAIVTAGVHYAAAVVPYSRGQRPKAEAGIAQWWVLFELRNQRFFSLRLNRHIAGLMLAAEPPGASETARLPRKVPAAEMDRPALRCVAGDPLRIWPNGRWRRSVSTTTVRFDRHATAVPYRFRPAEVDVRATRASGRTSKASSRESHCQPCCAAPFVADTTVDAHMTPARQTVQGWNAPRLIDESAYRAAHQRRSSKTSCINAGILQQGLPQLPGASASLGACARASGGGVADGPSTSNALSYGDRRKSHLEACGRDIKRLTAPARDFLPALEHANVRGPHYHH